MEEKVYIQTKFDSMVTNRNMQLVKAVLPYINSPLCNYLGFIIKYQELNNTLKINLNHNDIFSAKDKHILDDSTPNILNEIKNYLSDDEKNFIDSISSIFEIMQMFKNIENLDDITHMSTNFFNNLSDITGMDTSIFNNLGNTSDMDASIFNNLGDITGMDTSIFNNLGNTSDMDASINNNNNSNEERSHNKMNATTENLNNI